MKILNKQYELAHWRRHGHGLQHFAVKCPGLLLVILVPRHLQLYPSQV
jgi:hypothetical protein